LLDLLQAEKVTDKGHLDYYFHMNLAFFNQNHIVVVLHAQQLTLLSYRESFRTERVFRFFEN